VSGIAVTCFSDVFAVSKREGMYTLDDLLSAIWNTGAVEKAKLPLLKMARFGDKPSSKGSLRHDGNVLAVSGCEADYDEELMPFEMAVQRLQAAKILAIVYTSPSYQPDRPRWRIIAPFSRELAPGRRAAMVARLNGLFNDALGPESFSLSQAYYYGAVANNPHHRAVLIEGLPIDLHDELDSTAQGKARGGGEGTGGRDGLGDEAGLMEQIRSGECYHVPALTLAGWWAYQGMAFAAASKRLQTLFDETPAAQRDQRWSARRGALFRVLIWIYRREAEKSWAGPNGAAPGESPPSLGGVAAELAKQDLPALTWRVEGLIPDVGLVLVIGKPKAKKSWLVLDIALACATGTAALGKYSTQQCDTILLTLEDGPRRLQFRLCKLLAGKEAPDNLIYGFECPSGMACLTALATWLDENPTVRGLADARRNAFMQDYSDIGALANFANQRAIAMVVVHHARKQDAADPLDRVNGTMAVSAAADTILVLTRDRGTATATLSITGKDIVDDGDYSLAWDPLTCRWTVLGEASAVQRETVQDQIFNYLREQKEPVSVGEIADELNIGHGAIRKTLSRLKRRGAVEAVTRGRWQVPHG
jgi:hypothetical protein